MYKTNLWFVRESVFMNEYSKPFQCVLVLAIYICYYSFQIMVSFELDSEKADCCMTICNYYFLSTYFVYQIVYIDQIYG